MKKSLILLLALALLMPASGWAFYCQSSMSPDESEMCFRQVRLSENETTLVSEGTVLVANFARTMVSENSSAQADSTVEVADASAEGAYVVGIARSTIASGETAMVLVRGKGNVAVKNVEAISSGDALFVSTSGDVSKVTSTTQNQVGFALEADASGTNTRDTISAYITIV